MLNNWVQLLSAAVFVMTKNLGRMSCEMINSMPVQIDKDLFVHITFVIFMIYIVRHVLNVDRIGLS